MQLAKAGYKTIVCACTAQCVVRRRQGGGGVVWAGTAALRSTGRWCKSKRRGSLSSTNSTAAFGIHNNRFLAAVAVAFLLSSLSLHNLPPLFVRWFTRCTHRKAAATACGRGRGACRHCSYGPRCPPKSERRSGSGTPSSKPPKRGGGRGTSTKRRSRWSCRGCPAKSERGRCRRYRRRGCCCCCCWRREPSKPASGSATVAEGWPWRGGTCSCRGRCTPKGKGSRHRRSGCACERSWGWHSRTARPHFRVDR